MAQGQVKAFHEGGVDSPGEAQSLEGGLQVFQLAVLHLALDFGQPASAVGFLDLALQQF